MSSRGRAETATKKKFGKNLNKLTKKPAPPITSPARGNSRNGLLLLSTKRSSSGTGGSSSGLLASKTTAASSPTKETSTLPLGVTTESYTLGDALLGAVIGASRTADPQHAPDAWGVSNEKPETNENAMSENVALEPGEIQDSIPGADQRSQMNMLARERAEQRRLEEEARMNEQKGRAEERLRELEAKMAAERQQAVPTSFLARPREEVSQEPMIRAEDGASATRYNRGPTRPRALYDPGVPYSPKAGSTEETPEKNGGALSPRIELSDPAETPEPHYRMVSLASYDDRDRGERNTGGAPRMLFDPSTGSMVAVKGRDAGGDKKAPKPKGRSGRTGTPEHGDESENGSATKNGETKLKRPTRRGGEEARRRRENAAAKEGQKSKGRGSNKKRPPGEGRLPRTCGVLYTRDKKGNFVCADNCDGDLGYGCHSVPGGRVRNPDAYKQLVEEQHLYEAGNGYGMGGYEYAEAGSPQDHIMNPPKPPSPVVDWVKPNEKIELVTGAMESPTLRATAGEWAPSHAALTAASAAKQHLANVDNMPASIHHEHDTEDDEEDELDEDELPSFIGLGFDPADNMDSLMRSPSGEKSKARIDSEGLAALALDAPRSDDPTSRNIFAFGTSMAWGEPGAHTTEDLNGWSMLGNDPGATGAKKQDGTASSFLSLTTGSDTWGTGGGFTRLGGGPSIPNSRSTDADD